MENIQKKSFWGKLMKKNKVNTYDIAEKTNIPEEKVKEIINGDRPLPSDKVNDFVSAIKETKNESKNLKRNEALIFFADKDIKNLRLKFNYPTQKALARAIGVSQFTVSRVESNGVSALSTGILTKFYKFFKDELNIKVSSVKETKENYKVLKKEAANNKEAELNQYREFFKEHNLKELIKSTGMSIPEFSKYINIDNSTIYKYLGGKIDWSLDLYRKVFNGLFTEDLGVAREPIEIEEPVIEESTISNITSDSDSVEVEPTNITVTREGKNADLYEKEDMSYLCYNISNSFNPDTLFEYLINYCITKDVVKLSKLLNDYFRY